MMSILNNAQRQRLAAVQVLNVLIAKQMPI